MFNKDTWYNGDPKLRGMGVKLSYSKDEIQEMLYCRSDPIYFLSNYMKITSLDRGLINFVPYDYQREIIHTVHDARYTMCMMPRQSGKSTTVCSYFLWVTTFFGFKKIAILANRGELARKLLGDIKIAYENLPDYMKQGIEEWNKGSIRFENGSLIKATATSASAIRGESYNIVFLDEFAHVENNISEEFFSSAFPTIASGANSKLIIVSTPKGYNHFHRRWRDALDGKAPFETIRVYWKDVPRPGTDGLPMDPEVWREEKLKLMSEQEFNQEFDCTFVGSAGTLISASKLDALAFKDPVAEKEYIKIYEQPKEDHTYVAVVDTARGTGLDYSVVTVFDVTGSPHRPYNQVAVYRNNIIDPLELPTVVYSIAKTYNEAWLLVENNDIGGVVANSLHETFQYPKLLQTGVVPRKGTQIIFGPSGKTHPLPGLKMVSAVKRLGCQFLKSLIEKDKLIVNDFDTISELTQFIQDERGSFKADIGETDDIVMTLVMFGWLSDQDFMKNITSNVSVKDVLQDKKKQQMLSNQEFLAKVFHKKGLEPGAFVDKDGVVWKKVQGGSITSHIPDKYKMHEKSMFEW